ncbi:MAG TPA: FAD-binding protein [Steroidobacteraceae bacterium]|nr:FAD-binding protein [Steroidobacteraceae bacterium]
MGDFDEVFDFVVAGSGGGSMCAALVMRTTGKSALILEKTEFLGGTTARSGGVMWIPNNRFMERDGVEDSAEQAARYLDGLAASAAPAAGNTPERRAAYLREAPRMLDFLVGQGIRLRRVSEYPDYYDERPGGSVPGRAVVTELFDVNELGEWKERLRPSFIVAPTSLMPGLLQKPMQRAGMPYLAAALDEMMDLTAISQSWRLKLLGARIVLRTVAARLRGKRYVAGGASLQGRMLQAAVRAGVELRTQSGVSELLVEGGTVRGVVTIRDGRPWRVGARLGVLVNAGGFARNQAMRDRYQGGLPASWSMAAPGDTGEMIQEMMRHGAAIAQMEERVGHQIVLPPGAEASESKPGVQGLTAAPHAILVDQSGVRYMNEGGSYMAYCQGMLERHKSVPAIPSWAVFDHEHVRKYMLAGTMPGTQKPQHWYDSGFLKRAASLGELARACGLSPGALEKTVQRFNGFVERNRDEDFHRGERAYDRWLGDPFNRPSQSLGSISKPPYYAIAVVPGDVGTYGGVVCDQYARVLREDGSVIDGLYATGVSTASVMGRTYPGAGSSVGPSFAFGYIAARHAAHLDQR